MFERAAGVITLPARLALRAARGVLGRDGQEEERRQEERAPGPDPQHDPMPKPLDDVAVARKVETVIFRREGVEKGKIDVNAVEGVVWLRGEARTPELINELERSAQEVPEVKRVENLLHLPETPAPTRTETPPPQQEA